MTTVKELMQMCIDEIAKGNGDKDIHISMDDEGNGFHPLFYGFTSGAEAEAYGYDPKTDILLG